MLDEEGNLRTDWKRPTASDKTPGQDAGEEGETENLLLAPFHGEPGGMLDAEGNLDPLWRRPTNSAPEEAKPAEGDQHVVSTEAESRQARRIGASARVRVRVRVREARWIVITRPLTPVTRV